jgi:hypothetical protein
MLVIIVNGKFVPYFMKHHTMETYGEWRYSFTIFNLGPDALPQEKKKNFRYSMDRKLGGPEAGEERHVLALSGM